VPAESLKNESSEDEGSVTPKSVGAEYGTTPRKYAGPLILPVISRLPLPTAVSGERMRPSRLRLGGIVFELIRFPTAAQPASGKAVINSKPTIIYASGLFIALNTIYFRTMFIIIQSRFIAKWGSSYTSAFPPS
jgi:hypothetical protein